MPKKDFRLQLAFLALTIVLTAQIVNGQSAKPMFDDEVLMNPAKNSAWFDGNIKLVEIPKYRKEERKNVYHLENGYAQHRLKENRDKLKKSGTGNAVAVDIVFTKYPFSKEDWITNYYELLANRLIALFELDPSLNSNEIQWQLVMQTECKIEEEAKQLFHGIVIYIREKHEPRVPTIKPKKIPIEMEYPKINSLYQVIYTTAPSGYPNDPNLVNVLYPESIKKEGVESHIPKNIKSAGDPDCPKFRNRKKAPKRSLLKRIFGR